MRKTLLISAVTAAIIGAGVTTYMNQEQPKPEENQAVQIQARDSSAVTHESTSETPQRQETPPVTVEPAPIVAELAPAPAQAPVEQAESYAFSAEMAAAGLAESN
jgi:hypothetical protein